MAIKRTLTVSLRVSTDLLDQLEKVINQNKFQNLSEAIRECARTGLLVLDFEERINDSEKRKEFFEKMNSKIHEKRIFDWVGTLTDSELQGLFMALQLERESR